MDTGFQTVNNEDLFDTIYDNLKSKGNYVILFYFWFGYYDEKTNVCMYLDFHIVNIIN